MELYMYDLYSKIKILYFEDTVHEDKGLKYCTYHFIK